MVALNELWNEIDIDFELENYLIKLICEKIVK